MLLQATKDLSARLVKLMINNINICIKKRIDAEADFTNTKMNSQGNVNVFLLAYFSEFLISLCTFEYIFIL